MLRFTGYMVAYLIYSLSSFAQSNCTVYHNETLPVWAQNNSSVTFVETASNPEQDPEYFRRTLNDSSVFTSFANKKIMLSITGGAVSAHKTFQPIVLNYPDDALFKLALSCSRIGDLISDAKTSRSASISLLKYIKNKPSQKNLGETIIELEWHYLKYEKQTLINKEQAVQKYNEILEQVKVISSAHTSETFFVAWKAVLELIYSNHKEDINYCTSHTMVTSALLNGCTNCIGETFLFTSLLIDSGLQMPEGWTVEHQNYTNHITPILYQDSTQKVFNLAYGVFGNVDATLINWRESLKTILRGHNTTITNGEDRKINESIPYTYKSIWCQIGGFDLGYEVRHQIQNFSWLKVCEEFPEPPESNSDEVDTEGRLNEQEPIASEDEAKNSSSEGTEEQGFQVEDSSSVKEFENSNRVSTSFYENTSDQNNGLDDGTLTDATIHIKGNDISMRAFFRTHYNLIQHNTAEQILLRSYIELGEGADETIRHFSNKTLLDKLGIQRGVVSKHDHKFDSMDESTRSYYPIRELRLSHTPQLGAPYLYSLKSQTLIIKDKKFYDTLMKLDLSERYIALFDIMETAITNNLEDLLNELFDKNNLSASIIAQSEKGYVFNALLRIISDYSNLMNSAFYDLEDGDFHNLNWLLDYTFLKHELPKINRIFEYQEFIENNPILFIEALDQVQQIKPGSEPILFNYSREFNISMFNYLLPDQQRITDQFPYDFYRNFTAEVLFHKDFFFTAEANEEEKAELMANRPYSPIRIEDTVEKVYNSPYDIVLSTNTLGSCNGEVGFVQRGSLVLECRSNGTVGARNETDETKEGFENGLDQTTEEGFEANESVQNIPPSTDADESSLAAVEKWSDNDYINNLIDPRQEVILNHETWDLLLYVMSPSFNTVKNIFAIHHLQRDSIKDLVVSYIPALNPAIYTNLFDTIKYSAYSFEKISKSNFDMLDSLAYLTNIAEKSFKIEQERLSINPNATPIFFNNTLFEQVLYKEATERTKDSWTAQEMTGDFYSNPGFEGDHFHVMANVENNINVSIDVFLSDSSRRNTLK